MCFPPTENYENPKIKLKKRKKVRDYLLTRTVNTTFIVALNNARTGISSSFEQVPSVATGRSHGLGRRALHPLWIFFSFFFLTFFGRLFVFASLLALNTMIHHSLHFFFFFFLFTVLLCFYFFYRTGFS